MLRAFVAREDGTLDSVEPAGLSQDTGRWVWFDVMLEESEEIVALARRLNLNHLGVEDASTDLHIPKLDDYGDHLFVVLHAVVERSDLLGTTELDAFVGSRYLVTVHREEFPAVEWVIEHASHNAEDPALILARIAETSARQVLPLVAAVDEAAFEIEERAIAGQGDVVAEIQALRRDTIQLRRLALPQRDVLALLSNPSSPLVGERARQRFASARDHHARAVEHLDSGRALLSSTLDSYRGAVAEKMNEVMKVLTVYAAILLPMSLLAGIYGMNFANMPELQWRWGYFGLLGIMAAVAVGQWVYFARRGFVGSFKLKRIPTTVGKGLGRLARLPIDAAGLMMGHRSGEEDDGAGR